MIPKDIVSFIEARRFPLSDEKELQNAIEAEFFQNSIRYEREVDLGAGCVIDFMVGEVGLELKIKGQRRAIYRQCERYCQVERVKILVLATNAAMGMPSTINNKPVLIAHLGRGWL